MYKEYGVMNMLAGKAAEDTQTPGRKRGPNVIIVVSIIILLIALSTSGTLLLLAHKGHVDKPKTNTITPTPTPTNIYMETPPPRAVFYDTFINNALGWGISNSAGYIRTLADHNLTLTNTNPNTTLVESLPTNAIYDNFMASVDLTIVKAGMNDSAGIYIRGDSNLDHDYRIEINGANTFDIAKEYLDSQNNPQAVFLDGPRSSSALHPAGVQNTITDIKVRTNKGLLAGHDLWHSDQVTADAVLHEAGTGYKNCSSAQLLAEILQAYDRSGVRLRRA